MYQVAFLFLRVNGEEFWMINPECLTCYKD